MMRHALQSSFWEIMSNSAPISAISHVVSINRPLNHPLSAADFQKMLSFQSLMLFFKKLLLTTIVTFFPQMKIKLLPCELSKNNSSLLPSFNMLLCLLFPPLLSESQCPASQRTAYTPFLLRRSTETAAMCLRAMWWRVRDRWGRCAGRTCWCTGNTSRTDTCETHESRHELDLCYYYAQPGWLCTVQHNIPTATLWRDFVLTICVCSCSTDWKITFIHYIWKSVLLQLPTSLIIIIFSVRRMNNTDCLYLD